MSIEKALRTVFKSEKNVRLFMKELEDRENAEDVAYSIIGDKLADLPLSEIRKSLRENKIGREHPTFDEISARIAEQDDYILKPIDVEEGVQVCPRCGSSRTISYQKQTRSADEPMTTICHCVECDKGWHYSG